MLYKLKTAQYPKVPPSCRRVAIRHRRDAVVVGGVVFEIMLCICFLTMRRLNQKKKKNQTEPNVCHTAHNDKPVRTEQVVLTSSAVTLH